MTESEQASKRRTLRTRETGRSQIDAYKEKINIKHLKKIFKPEK